MQADYPAAHSMDTLFFAIDERGQVAVFDTGENGHAPDSAGDSDAFYDLTRLLLGNTDDSEYLPAEEEAELMRMYFYDYGYDHFDPIGPYQRLNNPPVPLHIDQLPPQFREHCAQIKLPVRFDQAEAVQPLEVHPCSFWYERAAYLCADGETVRPIPGEEGKFAEFVRRFRVESPHEAAKYCFEGPTQEGDPP